MGPICTALLMALLLLHPMQAAAQALSINQTPYDEAVNILDLRPITFEDVAERRLDPILQREGVTVGGWLSGQTVQIKAGMHHENHTVLNRRKPDLPLRLDARSGPIRGAVVFDGAFGSYALAGIGPAQMPGRSPLGTGILTLLFDEPQCLVGFRTWLDPHRFGVFPMQFPEGNLNLIFWNRDGQAMVEFWRFKDFGAQAYAFIQSSGSEPQITALTIQNLDPEGIGVDDLLLSPLCPYLVGQRLPPGFRLSSASGRG